MIKKSDFNALIKVFHSAVVEIAQKDTIEERKAVVEDWIHLMGQVDRAMGGLMYEKSKEERLAMVREFEANLEDFEGEDIL